MILCADNAEALFSGLTTNIHTSVMATLREHFDLLEKGGIAVPLYLYQLAARKHAEEACTQGVSQWIKVLWLSPNEDLEPAPDHNNLMFRLLLWQTEPPEPEEGFPVGAPASETSVSGGLDFWVGTVFGASFTEAFKLAETNPRPLIDMCRAFCTKFTLAPIASFATTAYQTVTWTMKGLLCLACPIPRVAGCDSEHLEFLLKSPGRKGAKNPPDCLLSRCPSVGRVLTTALISNPIWLARKTLYEKHYSAEQDWAEPLEILTKHFLSWNSALSTPDFQVDTLLNISHHTEHADTPSILTCCTTFTESARKWQEALRPEATFECEQAIADVTSLIQDALRTMEKEPSFTHQLPKYLDLIAHLEKALLVCISAPAVKVRQNLADQVMQYSEQHTGSTFQAAITAASTDISDSSAQQAVLAQYRLAQVGGFPKTSQTALAGPFLDMVEKTFPIASDPNQFEATHVSTLWELVSTDTALKGHSVQGARVIQDAQAFSKLTQKTSAVLQGYAAWSKLPECSPESISDPYHRTLINSAGVIRAATDAFLQHTAKKPLLSTPPTEQCYQKYAIFCCDLVTKQSSDLVDIAQDSMSSCAALLWPHVQTLSQIAGGAAHGTRWSDDCPIDRTIQQHFKSTLDRVSLDQLATSTKKVEDLLGSLQSDIAGFKSTLGSDFVLPPDGGGTSIDTLITEANLALTSMALTRCELKIMRRLAADSKSANKGAHCRKYINELSSDRKVNGESLLNAKVLALVKEHE